MCIFIRNFDGSFHSDSEETNTVDDDDGEASTRNVCSNEENNLASPSSTSSASSHDMDNNSEEQASNISVGREGILTLNHCSLESIRRDISSVSRGSDADSEEHRPKRRRLISSDPELPDFRATHSSNTDSGPSNSGDEGNGHFENTFRERSDRVLRVNFSLSMTVNM